MAGMTACMGGATGMVSGMGGTGLTGMYGGGATTGATATGSSSPALASQQATGQTSSLYGQTAAGAASTTGGYQQQQAGLYGTQQTSTTGGYQQTQQTAPPTGQYYQTQQTATAGAAATPTTAQTTPSMQQTQYGQSTGFGALSSTGGYQQQQQPQQTQQTSYSSLLPTQPGQQSVQQLQQQQQAQQQQQQQAQPQGYDQSATVGMKRTLDQTGLDQQQGQQPAQQQQRTEDQGPDLDLAMQNCGGQMGGGELAKQTDLAEGQHRLMILVKEDLLKGLMVDEYGRWMRKFIQDFAGAVTFYLQPKSEVPEGQKERVFSMVGELKKVIEANKRLIVYLADQGDEDLKKNEQKTEKYLIPSDKIGMLIGRGGTTINGIKNESGAKIQIAPEHETMPGSPERVVYLTGLQAAIDKAAELINAKVGGRSGEPPKPEVEEVPEDQVDMYVPSRSVGYLLGSKGSSLREICEKAGNGTRVRVSQDADVSTGDIKRGVKITADEEEKRAKCKQLIEERIEAWKKEWVEKHGDKAGVDEREICVKFVHPACMLGHVIGKKGGFIRQIREDARVSCKVLQDVLSVSMAVDLRPMVMYGTCDGFDQAMELLLEHVKATPPALKEAVKMPADQAAMRQPMRPGGGLRFNPMGQPQMGGMMGGGMMGGGMMGGGMMGGGMMGGGMMPQMGGMGMMQQPQMGGMMGMMQPQMGMVGGMGGYGGYGGQQAATASVVPELLQTPGVLGAQPIPGGVEVSLMPDRMGRVVGPGGSVIRNLSANSGTNVQAQKREHLTPGQRDRKLHIMGPPTQVQTAQTMLAGILRS